MIWANQPIHSFLVGCLNPCLQVTIVVVGLPQPISYMVDYGLMIYFVLLALSSCSIELKVDETMGLVPNYEFMRINVKSPKFF